MRTVVLTEPGLLELNWSWLPTWIGMNSTLKKEIEVECAKGVVGKEATDATLEAINDQVIAFLESRFPNIEGLRDYLDGLKFVRFKTPV